MNDAFFRRLNIASVILILTSGMLLMGVIVLSPLVPTFVVILSILVMTVALSLRVVVLLNRSWRAMRGFPPRDLSSPPPATYTCPKCGHRLQGLHGVFCPECGEVRPAPIEGET